MRGQKAFLSEVNGVPIAQGQERREFLAKRAEADVTISLSLCCIRSGSSQYT
jgi:hypothetical protein